LFDALSQELDVLVSLVQQKWKSGGQSANGGKKLVVRKG